MKRIYIALIISVMLLSSCTNSTKNNKETNVPNVTDNTKITVSREGTSIDSNDEKIKDDKHIETKVETEKDDDPIGIKKVNLSKVILFAKEENNSTVTIKIRDNNTSIEKAQLLRTINVKDLNCKNNILNKKIDDKEAQEQILKELNLEDNKANMFLDITERKNPIATYQEDTELLLSVTLNNENTTINELEENLIKDNYKKVEINK